MDKPILYEDESNIIHDCQDTCFGRDTVIVYTKCGIDVPAGMSFRSQREKSNCQRCMEQKQ